MSNEKIKTDLDRYLRNIKAYKRKQAILKVINMLNENPNLTKEMVGQDLKEVFSIAKREYKKQSLKENRIKKVKN